MNIIYTVKNQLCTGCGVCEDVCPTNSIEIKRIDGEHRPVLNEQTCLGDKCGRCLRVCPGVGIDLMGVSQGLYADAKVDKYIGRYASLYTGYSLDDDIRLHSASGGLVSQFLIYLLDKNIVDGAVVTGYSESDHITPYSYIARTKADVIKARSSKYCPVALNSVGNEIIKSEGKYVIIGLPCHIQGFRKRAEIDRKFREKVIGYFSIYCSSNRTFNAQDYIINKYAGGKDGITYFSYRDNGCLGNLTIDKGGDGREFHSLTTIEKSSECMELKSMISIPYTHYYKSLRSYFKPRRCLTCIDHYGALADINFGDIHINPYSDDYIGISSCIVRNHYWDNIIKNAVNEGYLKLDTVDAATLNKSQRVMLYPKKGLAKAQMALNKMAGYKNPDYSDAMKGVKVSWHDYMHQIIIGIQRFVGKRKSMWKIVDLTKK